ncbi:Zn-dependent exopeptidase [Trichodelitschia bisporula]|uniref:Zn-dependent exopeptidase n=1 Tax=Trichodelitschia bisporula TaxID=703511 RepID=A0A6G1IC36_9PEZI|nr:Zn-dependent exopeptidase [Trichodelitschia bisporula]
MRALLLIHAALASASALLSPQTPLSLSNSATHDPNSALLALHRRLIETPSISGNESTLAEWLADYLRSENLTVALLPVPTRGPNLLAHAGHSRATRVLITSHIDTVPPFIPYSLQHNGTEIWGRGSVDAKACVAAQITAFLHLLHNNTISPSDASLLFVTGEETGGEGMLSFSPTSPGYESVIFGEPTEGKLAAGHKGMVSFHLRVRGKAAHSGYPWLGVSANSVLVRALGVLLDLEPALPSSEKYGASTLNVGRVDGGVAANVVAQEARADVAIRLAGGEPDTVKAQIREALEPIKKDVEGKGGLLEIEWANRAYPPVDMDADVEGFESITVNYGTDVPNLAGEHRRYLYGPGSILVAHGDDEHLAIEDLVRAVGDYERLIMAALEK